MLARVLIALIRLYQWTLSPLVGGVCRFQPTCSHYAIDVLRYHGALRGSWLTLRRLARCHPFHPGGFDPAPLPKTSLPTGTDESSCNHSPPPPTSVRADSVLVNGQMVDRRQLSRQ